MGKLAKVLEKVNQALDMSKEARMARAKEQGFDVDNPVYHGTKTDFDAFDPDRVIGSQFWSTTDKAAIESGDVGAQGKGVIKELYHNIQNPSGWDEYDKFGIDELIAKGHDGLRLPDSDGQVTYVAFDPKQYRSTSAAFDPAKKDSANLLAGVTGLGVFAGLTPENADANTQPQFVDRVNNPSKYPHITNPNGSKSTHRMAAEFDEETGEWVAFPTVVLTDDGTLKAFENPFEALRYNKSIGNIKYYGSDKDAAINYAKGGYKKGTPLEPKPKPKNKTQAQDFTQRRASKRDQWKELRERTIGAHPLESFKNPPLIEQTIEAPKSQTLLDIASAAQKYNDFVDKPLINLIAPELPAELWRKQAYGQPTTLGERSLAALAMSPL